MNVHDAFATRTQPAAPNAEPLGQLFVMRCEPDPFTGERLNVGVFGVDRSGRRVARVVQQVGRLECLYGPAAAEVVWLAAAAKEAALAGVASPSPQVVFGGPMAFLHGTLEQAVDRAFAELVTVALPHKVREASGTKFTDEDDKECTIKETPLMTAVRTRNLPMAKLLVERKANVNYIDKQSGNQP